MLKLLQATTSNVILPRPNQRKVSPFISKAPNSKGISTNFQRKCKASAAEIGGSSPIFHGEESANEGIVCGSCKGNGWVVCDVCNGQMTNVRAKNNRLYRRCPSCKAVVILLNLEYQSNTWRK